VGKIIAINKKETYEKEGGGQPKTFLMVDKSIVGHFQPILNKVSSDTSGNDCSECEMIHR